MLTPRSATPMAHSGGDREPESNKLFFAPFSLLLFLLSLLKKYVVFFACDFGLLFSLALNC